MWGDKQWSEWGASQGFYKVWETVDGKARALGIDVQLKYNIGAIVEGSITVIEPDNEVWRIDIDLPGYQERWSTVKGNRTIKCDYALGDDVAPASDIEAENTFESVEHFAKFAMEYLHGIDPKIAYPDFRKAMRHF